MANEHGRLIPESHEGGQRRAIPVLVFQYRTFPDSDFLFPYVDQSIIRLEVVDSGGVSVYSTSKTGTSEYQRFLSKNADAIFSEQISSIEFKVPINQEHALFRCFELKPGHYRVRLNYDATLCPWTIRCRSWAFYKENRKRILVGPFLSNWVEFSVLPRRKGH
jgi:hypothetical protein